MCELRNRTASTTGLLWIFMCAATIWAVGCEKNSPNSQTKNDSSASPSCADGEVAVGGHCCFNGQRWAAQSEACEGIPTCPEGTSYGISCPPAPLAPAKKIKWLELACEDGQQSACGVLSGYYLTGKATSKDAEKARTLAERACDSEVWSGCNTLGLIHIQGEGTAAAPEKARAFFEKACQQDDGEACKNLALMYAKGVGIEADQERALSLYRQSCKLDFEPACKVVERMEKMNQDRASELLASSSKACEQGDQTACAEAGELLVFGSAGEPDVQRGMSLLDKSCGAGVGAACRVLATAFYAGQGVDEDAERARVFAERGCALDEFDACNILGLLYMVEPGPDVDIEKAREILGRACEAENPRACSNLGRAYLMEDEGVSPNPAKASEALEIACDRGISEACERAGTNKKSQ